MDSARDNLLVCNFKECYKEICSIGFVTNCSHIFCENHGKNIVTTMTCPACKKDFTDPHEIFETNLSIPKSAQKIMLAGFNPKDIIEIARSGLGFWEYQKRQETYNLKRKLEHYKKAFTDSQKRLQETTKDKDAQIEALDVEKQKLMKEKQDLNLELAGKSDELVKMIQKVKRMKPTI